MTVCTNRANDFAAMVRQNAKDSAESKHDPNNGQFTGGGGSHTEHAAHHDREAAKHHALASKHRNDPELSGRHIEAAQLHENARGDHNEAHEQPTQNRNKTQARLSSIHANNASSKLSR